MEKRKILSIGKDSSWHKDRWLIGQIVEVEVERIKKGGMCSAFIVIDYPGAGKTRAFCCAVKLSKRRY